MALGGGFDFILDPYNKVSALVEVNKLLVPTPSDSNGDGTINSQDDYYNETFVSGVFSSFGDAPDGFSEELKNLPGHLVQSIPTKIHLPLEPVTSMKVTRKGPVNLLLLELDLNTHL